MKQPCKNCQDRQIGCHINCPRYEEYRQQNEMIKRRKWEEQQVSDGPKEIVEEMLRKKKRRGR